MKVYPLTQFRESIQKRLRDLARKKRKELIQFRWGNDVMLRLESLARKGKMFRGSALLAIYEQLSGTKPTNTIVDIACVMELIQTGLIIHDDILDKSTLRRGKPTLHMQYRDILTGSKQDIEHASKMFALCVGDICFHWADSILADALQKTPHLASAAKKISCELITVQLAQMRDISQEGSGDPTPEEIEGLYRWKTARYSFSLPLTIGAVLANASEKEVRAIDAIGENIGLIYQLVDDDLGMFGSSDVTGKPAFIDVAENKKTLLRYYLFKTLHASEKKRFKKIFGNPKPDEKDISSVREKLIRSGARQVVFDRIKLLREETKTLIASSELPGGTQTLLKEILHRVVERNA